MSEIRRVNTGDAPRSVYHAGDAQRTVNTARTVKTASALNQDEYEAARRRAQQQAATSTRRTRSFNRVQQSDVDSYRAAQAQRQAAAGTAAAEVPQAQQPAQSAQPLTQAQRQAAELQRRAQARSTQGAQRTQVRRLDLNGTKSARQHYDVNSDPEYEARAARRAAQQQAAPAPAAQPAPAPEQGGEVMQASRTTHKASGSGAKGAARKGGVAAAGGGGKPPRGGKGGKNGGPYDKNGKKKKKGGWWKVLLITLLAIVLIFGGTVAIIMHAVAPEAGSISLNQLINTPKEYQDKEFNILVVGIDRSDETGDAEADAEVNDGMTDMILYLHFNNETGQVKMLQIPRNILVTTDASYSGNYQINAIAKTQGTNGNNNISALADEIYNMFGLPCDGYISVRLEALTQMIDAFGGIQVYVPQAMDYDNSHLDAGYQTMDGNAAEFFLRTRKIYADSDLGRLNMQRYFYAALFARLRSMTVWDIAKLLPVFMNYMETDLNISDLVSVAVSMLKVSSADIMMCQVPVYMGNIYYAGNDIDVVARQETADLLNQYFRENLGAIDASALNIVGDDGLIDLSGRTPSDPNVQFMGTLNEEIADAQVNDNIDGSATTDVYDVATPAPETDGTDSAADGSADSEPAA